MPGCRHARDQTATFESGLISCHLPKRSPSVTLHSATIEVLKLETGGYVFACGFFLSSPSLDYGSCTGQRVPPKHGVTVGAANLCCVGRWNRRLLLWCGTGSCLPRFIEVLAPFVPRRPRRRFVSSMEHGACAL